MVTRSFVPVETGRGTTPDPDSPLAGQPTIYALAFQYDDAAAQRAEETVWSWVRRCAETLQSDPTYRRLNPTSEWSGPNLVAVKSRGRTVAAFADVPTYYLPSPSDSAFFESVGISQVADRLAVVVEIAYGQDHNVSYVQDDTELGPHPQFDLLLGANKALTR
jgi:hypothetical protein